MAHATLRRFDASDLDWLVQQHDRIYRREEGFDSSFAPLVRSILEEFVAGHDPTREAGWIAQRDGLPVGSIFCVALSATTAKLRLFLTTPEGRGQGIGRLLLGTCMGFARDAGYCDMTLWTHESHRAACALYAASGWELTESKPVHSFGRNLIEQSWRVDL